MHFTVYEQGELFRYAFMLGLALGVYYDLFRLIRALGFTKRLDVFIQDIVFMSGSALLCFMFAQTTVHGHLRAFLLIGHLIGLLSWRFSIGMIAGILIGLSAKLFKLIARICNGLFFHTAKIIQKLSANISMNMRDIAKMMTKNKKIKKIFPNF